MVAFTDTLEGVLRDLNFAIAMLKLLEDQYKIYELGEIAEDLERAYRRLKLYVNEVKKG